MNTYPLTPRDQLPGDHIVLGVDVGSTTVKAVAVDPHTRAIVWSEYRRHETRLADTLLALLVEIGDAFANIQLDHIRIFATGSGAGPLCEPLGAKFVQEVNAVTMAVEVLHPDAGSVVELGGQDAKIIMFTEDAAGGKRASASMNDKCASGTGATIDKCLIKVGIAREEIRQLQWDPSRLHHVAAKCGVFAETDIVNLVKAGIPSSEIMCSLADAIVSQNLSVLTRGNTLKPKVLLLGGPNTFLPFLQACWRQRIPETWRARGFRYPSDVPVDQLITVPPNAEYYAAYGAVLYGLHEPANTGKYRGLDPLKAFVAGGRTLQLAASAGPGLATEPAELEAFRRAYAIPSFVPATFEPGTRVRAVVGLDGGSTSSKAVLMDEAGRILTKQYQLSQGNPIEDAKQLLARIKAFVHDQGATLDVLGFGATGYAADVLEESLRADVNIVETVAHQMAAVKFFGDVDVICDIGGQDIKVLFMAKGDIRNFRLSNQCSAGNGMLLQAMADQFGVPVADYADVAFRAGLTPKFSYGCAVFLDADRVNFQKEGYKKEELLAGLAMVLPKNVWQYVVQIPRMAALGRRYVLQGGTQYNLAAVKAQVDYIKARVPDAEIHVHPHPGEAGAIGAALETLRVVTRRGHSTFVGLDAAIDLVYVTRNDETTRCHFCPNDCARTFIDARTPDGGTTRYISGFSCEKGTVESVEALKTLTARRKDLRLRFPNLVDYESKVLFRSFYTPRPLPEANAVVDDVEVRKTLFGGVKRTPVRRTFQRSSEAAQQRRRQHPDRHPARAQHLLHRADLAHLLRGAGHPERPHRLQRLHVGGALGGGRQVRIDRSVLSLEGLPGAHPQPALSQAAQQVRLHLLPVHHARAVVRRQHDGQHVVPDRGRRPEGGARRVHEGDRLLRGAGIEYVDDAVTLAEPNYFARQMFEMWGERLGITEDENDWACREGFAALRALDEDLEQRGLEILQQLEEESKVGVLLLGRPYHLDPGLNHGVLEEFQALGYPVLSIRSIPKDPKWLARFFKDDLARGFVSSPLDVSDVWPENYSANSVQKVWAAKFAARHPNIVVLDLSSFKCGHDAPTYGLIDNIISASGTPYSALHDIDANKPGGSIKIRVRTYAHTLSLHEERLQDLAAKRSELQRRVDEKRRELLRDREHALVFRRNQDADAQRTDMDAAYRAYLSEDPVLPAFSEELPAGVGDALQGVPSLSAERAKVHEVNG